MKGTIARVMSDKGYGFIDSEEQEGDLFFHKSNLVEVSFFDLQKGQTVEFDLGEGRKGPEAINIKLSQDDGSDEGEAASESEPESEPESLEDAPEDE